VVSNLDQLQAAVATGGTYSITAHITLTGSLTLNGTNTSLTLLGSTSDCGGLCVLDANLVGGHFVVPMNYTLVMDSVTLVNSRRGVGWPEACVGGVLPGSAQPLTMSGRCSAGPFSYADLSNRWNDWNDIPCANLMCSSVVVAANASLYVANSRFSSNGGTSDASYIALGAAIGMIPAAHGEFVITNTSFVDNFVQSTVGSTLNSGGAIAMLQPYNAFEYPVHFRGGFAAESEIAASRSSDLDYLDMSYLTTRTGGGGYKPPITLTDCIFSGNTAQTGGALFLALNAGNLTVERCTFHDNTAQGNYQLASGAGGAVYIRMLPHGRPFKGAFHPELPVPNFDYDDPDFLLHAHYLFLNSNLTSAATTVNHSTLLPALAPLVVPSLRLRVPTS
jgi:hypothetical protein